MKLDFYYLQQVKETFGPCQSNLHSMQNNVEEALKVAVSHAYYSKSDRLNETLATPFQAQDGKEDYNQPAPKEFEQTFQTLCKI